MVIEFTEADKHSEPAIKKLIEAGHYVATRSVADVDCLWVRLSTRVNAQLLELYPRVRCIVSPTTGTDHIDVAECEKRGVSVLSLRGEAEFLRGVRATAEHTVGLMLWALRGWNNVSRSQVFERPYKSGTELSGATVGIIGYGRIGSQVAKLVRAFGAYVTEGQFNADVVSVHLPLDSTTSNYCGRSFFRGCKHGAVFINTSRGAIVDEDELVQAMSYRQISRAAVDVVNHEERLFQSPLFKFGVENPDRVLITPHIGGYTRESLEKCELFMAEKLLNHIGTNGNDKSLRTGVCAGIPGTVA